ncbi:3-mercaptopyruvate sulfurtransferase [Consotaella aegiceratis]|uniref:3-mercaptopyruvate sulfurtransferase n=1 Tax=Consotaella aegiceratis TaxID=3097961 RepID=UPI002F41A2B5
MYRKDLLITPDDLAAHLSQVGRGLSIVDASWYLPAQGRIASEEFAAGHIPGAVFFDHDAVVDPRSSLPHTLPPASNFAEAAGALGLSATDTIVVYDGMGLFSAPRAWWLFRTFGARDVRVLDGGFAAWKAAGLPIEAGAASPKPAEFHAVFNAEAAVSLEEMRRLVADGAMQVADARPAERFAGAVPEPRQGVRGGHMPGARNLPFSLLAEDGRLKPPEQLAAAFAEAGLDPQRPIVTSCGSGVTAAVINLALAALGANGTRLYDGSWTEWGSQPDTPVVTGPPSGSPS